MKVSLTKAEAEEAIAVWISSRLADGFDVDGANIGFDEQHEVVIEAEIIEIPKKEAV